LKGNYSKLTWMLLPLTFLMQGCAKSDPGENASREYMQSGQEQIRPAAVAGSWYSNNPEALREQITAFLNNAKIVDVKGHIIGLVAPHAGYSFSGPTAAHAYKQVSNKEYDTVIILAPNHGYEGRFTGASVYSGDGYRTPLGVAYVNKIMAKDIVDATEVAQFSTSGHGGEHSLEIQLPFVQILLPDAKIVPIVLGDPQWTTCRDLGMAIAKAVGQKKVLIVASSDLYHAPSQTGNWYDECVATNTATLDAIENFDAQSFNRGVASGKYQCCGAGPITTLLVAAKELGANNAEVVHRTNSGDVTGRKSGYIVGYGSVVILKDSNPLRKQNQESKQNNETNSNKIEFSPLGVKTQKRLLRMAREAIEYYLETGERKKYQPTYEVMNEKRGVFVTITKAGRLRGCIGYHENDRPLYELVPDRALAAAFGDPRFPKLNKYELDDITINISVYLTNVYKINDISEFEMGVHGIIMYKNGRGATYLPEVPIEAGWTSVEEEMRSLCNKAGLPQDAWRQGAEFYVYETQVFDESLLK
jgi:AmmeMemoRadiSam system protein B/AmmeMemoRadiSam system protein A